MFCGSCCSPHEKVRYGVASERGIIFFCGLSSFEPWDNSEFEVFVDLQKAGPSPSMGMRIFPGVDRDRSILFLPRAIRSSFLPFRMLRGGTIA